MQNKIIASIATAAIFAASSTAAQAAPKLMSDAQLDKVVAGATVETKSGKLIWTVTNLDPLEGYNVGGNGRTGNAGPGLLKAAAAGGVLVK